MPELKFFSKERGHKQECETVPEGISSFMEECCSLFCDRLLIDTSEILNNPCAMNVVRKAFDRCIEGAGFVIRGGALLHKPQD